MRERGHGVLRFVAVWGTFAIFCSLFVVLIAVNVAEGTFQTADMLVGCGGVAIGWLVAQYMRRQLPEREQRQR